MKRDEIKVGTYLKQGWCDIILCVTEVLKTRVKVRVVQDTPDGWGNKIGSTITLLNRDLELLFITKIPYNIISVSNLEVGDRYHMDQPTEENFAYAPEIMRITQVGKDFLHQLLKFPDGTTIMRRIKRDRYVFKTFK